MKSNLYASVHSPSECSFFLNQISDFIPIIDHSFREFCDSDLDIEELDAAARKLPLKKAPGTDGLTGNFHKHFWEEIRKLLFKAILECIENQQFMPTMKQGLITLIPKQNKDKRLLDHLRPITLLNTDYKLLCGCIAARLKESVQNY